MTDEPEDLVLHMLRDMRARLDAIETKHDEQFSEVIGRLDTLGKSFDEVRTASIYGLGLTQTANLKIADHEAKLAAREREPAEMERRFDELEALLTKD